RPARNVGQSLLPCARGHLRDVRTSKNGVALVFREYPRSVLRRNSPGDQRLRRNFPELTTWKFAWRLSRDLAFRNGRHVDHGSPGSDHVSRRPAAKWGRARNRLRASRLPSESRGGGRNVGLRDPTGAAGTKLADRGDEW